MRNFRNAAIAGVTAVAVAFGGSAVAVAQDTNNGTSSSFTSGFGQPGDATPKDIATALSSENGFWALGNITNRDTDAYLTDMYGKTVDDTKVPQWARIWRDLVNWLLLLTGIGAVIGALNFTFHEGYLPHPIPKP